MQQIPIQHSPSQAGLDALEFCQTARKVLKANIPPLLSLEEKTVAIVAINRMDHNELRAALINLSKSEPTHRARQSPRSISDDDLCSNCGHCTYRPGELSQCDKGWPTVDQDEVENCSEFEQLCSDSVGTGPGDA